MKYRMLCVSLYAVLAAPIAAREGNISKEDAALKMIAAGRWSLSEIVGRTALSPNWVDPYSIVKIDENTFQINSLIPLEEQYLGIYNFKKSAPHVRAQTTEFDCLNLTYAHTGWKYPGGFTSRKIIGGKSTKKFGPYYPGYFSTQVCPVFTPEGSAVKAPRAIYDAWTELSKRAAVAERAEIVSWLDKGLKEIKVKQVSDGKSLTSTGTYILNNAVYVNTKENTVYAKTLSFEGNETIKTFVHCRLGTGVFQNDAGDISPFKADPIFVDWMCKGLHPSTIRSEQAFDFPREQEKGSGEGVTSASTKSMIEDRPIQQGASIDAAKRKCAQLGFKLGTPAFGECVLTVSE
jgi:hypothetical protein